MNRQPYGTPPKWWKPKLRRWWVKFTRGYRQRKLRRVQKLMTVEAHGLDHLATAVRKGHGVLVTPNHSFHYDSEVVYAAADKIDRPLYFLTAWQVFAMSGRIGRWALQHMGAFSIDRESTDRQAFRQSIAILQEAPHPLVIFPEGDIYHTGDRVTHFREGAAAIALAAARRGARPISIIPCGVRCWYLEDPLPSLLRVMESLEEHVRLRPAFDLPLDRRIHRLARTLLSIKEIDYLDAPQPGSVRERVAKLTSCILDQLEERYGLTAGERSPPERVKAIRQKVILALDSVAGESLHQRTQAERKQELRLLERDLEDLHCATQLYSYPGDYVAEKPSLARIAETIDKFEEDVLDRELPTVHARRKAAVSFGEPIELSEAAARHTDARALTSDLQNRVQRLVDALSTRETPACSYDEFCDAAAQLAAAQLAAAQLAAAQLAAATSND